MVDELCRLEAELDGIGGRWGQVVLVEDDAVRLDWRTCPGIEAFRLLDQDLED